MDGVAANTQKAFYINAYNLSVISGILKAYPVDSPLKAHGLFKEQLFEIAGKKMTLSELEKKVLLERYQDPRLHFVLNCGALGCPPLIPEAYLPATLEKQLEEQTKKALDNPNFIRVDSFTETIALSQIFEWYKQDFQPSVSAFIAKHRSQKLAADFQTTYYNYDWTLNDQNPIKAEGDDKKKKFVPIVAATTLPRGSFEFKSFNGMYTAKYQNDVYGGPLRSSFFSSFNQFSYGLNGRLDLGLDLVVRSTLLGDFSDRSLFRVFTLPNGTCVHVDESMRGNTDSINIYKASGVSHIAPRVRWSPFKKMPGFTLQQAIYMPIQKKVDGSWVWVTDFFFAHNFTPKTQLFVALTIWQPIYPGQKFKLSQPFLKGFFTWLPNNRFSIYATTTWLYEWGAGMKFLILPGLEIELLATRYLPIPLVENYFGKGASTINMGLRVGL